LVAAVAGIPWHVIAAKDPVMPSWLTIAVFCLLSSILMVLLPLALEQTRDQVMYAAIFVWCILLIGVLEVLGWVVLSKHLIGPEAKRLELRIAELAETIGSK